MLGNAHTQAHTPITRAWTIWTRSMHTWAHTMHTRKHIVGHAPAMHARIGWWARRDARKHMHRKNAHTWTCTMHTHSHRQWGKHVGRRGSGELTPTCMHQQSYTNIWGCRTGYQTMHGRQCVSNCWQRRVRDSLAKQHLLAGGLAVASWLGGWLGPLLQLAHSSLRPDQTLVLLEATVCINSGHRVNA